MAEQSKEKDAQPLLYIIPDRDNLINQRSQAADT